MEETKYCSNCGSQIDVRAEICPECGVRQAPPKTIKNNQEKNPALAALLSFLIVGLGQIYNGDVRRGVLLLIGAIISAILWLVVIGIIFSIIIWLYAIYDAYTGAKMINEGIQG